MIPNEEDPARGTSLMAAARRPPLALDLPLAEWTAALEALGQPAYRARQVFHALHAEGVRDWAAVRTLPTSLRAALAERYPLGRAAVVRRAQSSDGTVKYLLGLDDGREIETVHIPDADRVTVCVSSQAGCALACAFCATGRLGLLRNLSAGEIVDQVYQARANAPAPNVVFMGMGEPLANYAAVVRAIGLLLDPAGLGLSPRRVTLSTSGLPDQIRRLAAEDLGIRLAVSLHAADDATRTALMPINARYPLAEVLAAARDYAARSGRRVSFEYVMLAGVNDSSADAARLAALLPPRLAHVNLIPYNPTDAAFQGSSPARIQRFAAWLDSRGVACSIRRSRGRDVDAACGQLAGRTPAAPTAQPAHSRREVQGPVLSPLPVGEGRRPLAKRSAPEGPHGNNRVPLPTGGGGEGAPGSGVPHPMGAR
jgi:23S rRNA (adenine2503-C2)-methyltransferase